MRHLIEEFFKQKVFCQTYGLKTYTHIYIVQRCCESSVLTKRPGNTSRINGAARFDIGYHNRFHINDWLSLKLLKPV